MSDKKIIELDLRAFDRVSKAMSKAMSKEEPRYYLKGVFVKDVGNKRRYVATNGHIMFLIETKKPSDYLPENGLILHTFEKIGKTSRFCSTFLEYAFDGKYLIGKNFDTDKILSFSIVDGTFPDYERVIPQNPKETKKQIAFDIRYLKNVADFFGVKSLPIFKQNKDESPAVFEKNSEQFEKMIAILMPMNRI